MISILGGVLIYISKIQKINKNSNNDYKFIYIDIHDYQFAYFLLVGIVT